MKIFLLSLASVLGLGLGGCATDDSLVSDQEYNAYRGPAPAAPDPTRHVPGHPASGSVRY